jgi:predicted dehydrogenase
MKNLALIGAQSRRQAEVATLLARHYDKLKIVCVVDKSLEAAKQLAERFGAKPINDLSGVVKDSSIQLVCLDIPYEERLRTIELSAESGKDILCFGPVVPSLEDTRRTIDLVKKGGVRLYAPFLLRNNPHLKSTKDMIKVEGRELVSIHFSIKQKEAPGGVLLDLGSHAFDFVRWFTGFKITRMFCQVGNFEGDETSASILGVLETGAFLSMDMIRSHIAETICEAIYSDALILLTPSNGAVHVDVAGRERQDYPTVDPLRFAVDEVVSSIENGSKPPVDYADIEAAAFLVEQARLSAKQGAPVNSKT